MNKRVTGLLLAAVVAVVALLFLWKLTATDKAPHPQTALPNNPTPTAEEATPDSEPQVPQAADETARSFAVGNSSVQQAQQVAASRPVLEGRIGRIVVEFPGGVDCSSTKIRVMPPTNTGREVASRYGSGYLDVLSGSYFVEISGVPQAIEVTARQELIVKVGAIRIRASEGAAINVLDETGRKLAWGYGSLELGLPVGTYTVQIGDDSREAIIRENAITEL